MIDLISLAIVVAATVKVTEYRAEKRAKALAAAGPTHGESPNTVAKPRHFTASSRRLLLETFGEYCQGPDGPVIKHAFRSRTAQSLIEKRLAKCAFARVTDVVPPESGILTYRLAPLPPGTKGTALDAVRAVWDKGGDVYLSVTCILDKGERVVALSPGPMPNDIAWSEHFARLDQKYDIGRPIITPPPAVDPETLNGSAHPNSPPDPEPSAPAQE